VKRLVLLSRRPVRAEDVAPEVKLAFLRDLVDVTTGDTVIRDAISVTIPLFVNKSPNNPAPPASDA